MQFHFTISNKYYLYTSHYEGGFQGGPDEIFVYLLFIQCTFIVQSVDQTVDNFQLNLRMKWLGLPFFYFALHDIIFIKLF